VRTLLLLLAACTCRTEQDPVVPEAPKNTVPFELTEASVPGFPDLRTSTAQHLQLDRLPATYVLPSVTLPPKVAEITDDFVLQAEEVPNPKGARRNLMVLRAPLPFPTDDFEQGFAPEGMAVSIGGIPVDFGKGPAPLALRSTWRIAGRHLVLSHHELPPEGSLVLHYPKVREEIDRHDPSKWPANKFVQSSVTLDGMTRHGLSLVAPTTAEWTLTLPTTRATFEGWLALERPPIDKPRSDGAAITLSVVVDGKEEVVDRQELPEASQEFRQWRADLSQWAGKEVKLRLVSETLDNTLFDWVFLGSPTVWGPPQTDARRVVIVALDTTRPDKLSLHGYSRPTTPELDAWASTGVVFDRTWSVAPRTRPSFRSSTTGRLPLEAVGATNLSETFAQRGFATAGIVANVHLQPRFDFDDGYDSWFFDGKATATQQVDRSLAWLEGYSELDSFLFVHFMDPHMAYDPPPEYREKFAPELDPALVGKVRRQDVGEMARLGQLDDTKKKQLEDLHDAEIAYLSHELGRFFEAIDKMPGRTLVVVHSDHGEEFWEHGGFEHNHSLYDELVRTVLILRPRGGLPEGRRLQTPTTLMDIGPTLYDLFGFTQVPPYDGRSLVPLLAGKGDWPERPLPVGYLQYSHERWGVLWNDHKYILHTGTGREELYDLKADPGETSDLAAQRDLGPYRQKLAEAHRIEVGPGFRVRLSLEPGGQPLTVQLPAVARAADVLDPEAVVEHRANVESGETPKLFPQDIGSVKLADDKRSLVFTPGRVPNGIVYVLFDAPADPASVKLVLGDKELALEDLKRGRGWKDGEHSVVIEPGTLVIPPPTEAARMGIAPGKHSAGNDLEMLCRLGYIEEGCDEILAAPPSEDAVEDEHEDEG
jgi:arylsulfatase A-like enzyme